MSDSASNATIGPNDRPPNPLADFGEWLGVDVSSAGMVAAWTDTRSGTSQDVFSDTLTP